MAKETREEWEATEACAVQLPSLSLIGGQFPRKIACEREEDFEQRGVSGIHDWLPVPSRFGHSLSDSAMVP